MKRSLTITVLILAAAAFLGWRNHFVLAALRAENEQTVIRARNAGLNPDGGPLKRRSGRNRDSQAARAASVEELARTMVEVHRNILNAESTASGTSVGMANTFYQVNETLYRLSAEEAELLLEHLRKLDDGSDTIPSILAISVVVSLSQSRPADAITLAEKVAALYPEGDDIMTTAARDSFGGWAKRDPLAALEWLRKRRSSDSGLITPDFKRGIISPLARIDPTLAFRLANEFGLPVGEVLAQDFAASATTQTERENILVSMRGFIGSVEDAEARERFSSTLISTMFEKARNQGFNEATQWLEYGGLSVAEVEAVISELGYRSFDDAGRWLEWMDTKFPEQSSKGIARMMKGWTQSDYPAATAWLEGTLDGSLRRQATITYAETVARYHPDVAAKWALTLDQDEQRESLLESIHSVWMKKDKAAAEAFAKQHGITTQTP